MSHVDLQKSQNRVSVSLALAYSPPAYWLTHTQWIYALISHNFTNTCFMVWFTVFTLSSLLWNIFSGLYFSCFPELCSVFRLRSVRFHNDSANLRKSNPCHSLSKHSSDKYTHNFRWFIQSKHLIDVNISQLIHFIKNLHNDLIWVKIGEKKERNSRIGIGQRPVHQVSQTWLAN